MQVSRLVGLSVASCRWFIRQSVQQAGKFDEHELELARGGVGFPRHAFTTPRPLSYIIPRPPHRLPTEISILFSLKIVLHCIVYNLCYVAHSVKWLGTGGEKYRTWRETTAEWTSSCLLFIPYLVGEMRGTCSTRVEVKKWTQMFNRKMWKGVIRHAI